MLTRLSVVEHYRNLWNFVRVVYEKEENGTSICNETTCPRMSAGAYVSRIQEPESLGAC